MHALKAIVNRFNAANVTYAIGGSLLLYAHHLVDAFNDIDILIVKDDFDKAHAILTDMGIEQPTKKSDRYQTECFKTYLVQGSKVDLMANLVITHHSRTYNHCFDASSIVEYKVVHAIRLPLMSLEDWYVIYLLIEREDKVHLLEDYFYQFGIRHSNILRPILNRNISPLIKSKIRSLIETS
jgi:hypothetical protein